MTTDRNAAQVLTYAWPVPRGFTPPEPEPREWTLRDDLASALETSYRLADAALRTIREAGYVIVPKDGGDSIPWNDEVWD